MLLQIREILPSAMVEIVGHVCDLLRDDIRLLDRMKGARSLMQ